MSHETHDTGEYGGRHVVVTGASGGIGSATAAWLAERGAQVYALDLRPASSAGTFVECDVTDAGQVAQACATVLGISGGRVDGVVAAAGISEDDVPAESMRVEQFDAILAVNLRGAFLTATQFGRVMLDQGAGRIVAVSSMSGNLIVNDPQRQCAYNASKAGLTALVKSLAVEWGPRGVRVNAVSPGYVDTPLLALKKHMHDGWKGRGVLHRFAATQEIAGAIGYLLSDAAAFCIGTELVIDGGYSLR